jgi:hypothetical protein
MEMLKVGMNIKPNSVLCFDKNKTQYGVSAMINENLFNAVELSKQSNKPFKPMRVRIKRIGADAFEVINLQNNEAVIEKGLKVTIPTKYNLKELKSNMESCNLMKRTSKKSNEQNKFMKMVRN